MTKLDKKSAMETETPERKSVIYSQNFLKSPELVRTLLDKSSIGTNDIVYEIGPGKGIITEQLAQRCQKVIAIEKDPELAFQLKQQFVQNQKVEIHQRDFLDYQLSQEEYKVFSNIPFIITADIIRKLIEAKTPPKDSYLIVQEEAAEKFSGLPYANKETLFSVLIKPWFELSVVHHFRRTDFSPAPNVETVLLRLQRREEPLVETNNSQLYRDFVVYGFSQWKPTLSEALEGIFTHEQFGRLAKDLGFKKSAKPTELSFNQWLGLFKYFLVGVEKSKRQLITGSERKLRKQQENLEKIYRTRTIRDWRKK